MKHHIKTNKQFLKILIIMLIITLLVGVIKTVRGQGKLGTTMNELMVEFNGPGFTGTFKIDTLNTNKRFVVYLSKEEDLLIYYYFTERPEESIYMTAMHAQTDAIFRNMIALADEEYIRMDENLWHKYFEGGVVEIELIFQSQEKYPYIIFTYSLY